jgi:hypothetical protein
MLNFTLKGTYQDAAGFNWDYYGDDANASNFYIVPKPQFVMDNSGKPSFQITRYSTDDANNGAGYCRFDVELSVPANIEDAVRAQIPSKFPNAKAPYFFLALDYNPGGKAYFEFSSTGGNVTFGAKASQFGSNVASFLLQMTKEQLDTLTAAFSTSGGAYEVEYHLSVPARLPAVNAVLSFDSSIAYQYQVTQPSFNSWGNETSPGSVQTLLNESASSTIDITWGVSNPPEALRQAVAGWANGTLADLVSAEVQETIKLQGLQSGQSFNINEVSSFTSTYGENMVIDWLISPRVALPSFPSLGLNIANFTSTVNERQQQMIVSVFLPFKSDSDGSGNVPAPTLPNGTTPQTLVDHVAVTVSYPGLPQANATHTFTRNESATFTAAYDETAGPTWGLDYTVTYADTSMAPVAGSVTGITQGSYTLQVEEAGILTVVFDAQQAFATEGAKPTEIEVLFSYVDRNGGGNLIQQAILIKATDNPQQGSITSIQPMPLNSRYNYQVTYVYPGAVQYQAPLVQGQTGFLQMIPAADALHSTNLIIFVPSSQADTEPVFDATVQMWYVSPPTLPPSVSSQPSKDSPAVFTITPATDSSGNLFGHETFLGLLSGDEPLVYSASIDAAEGQIDINDTLIENDQASIMVTPTQRYFTLEISPAPIDWNTASFMSVEVLITAKVAQGTAPSAPTTQPPQREYTWNKGEGGSKYVTYPIQDGNQVSYDWEVNYITPGKPVQTVKRSGATDLILNIPATPTSATAAGAGKPAR